MPGRRSAKRNASGSRRSARQPALSRRRRPPLIQQTGVPWRRKTSLIRPAKYVLWEVVKASDTRKTRLAYLSSALYSCLHFLSVLTHAIFRPSSAAALSTGRHCVQQIRLWRSQQQKGQAAPDPAAAIEEGTSGGLNGALKAPGSKPPKEINPENFPTQRRLRRRSRSSKSWRQWTRRRPTRWSSVTRGTRHSSALRAQRCVVPSGRRRGTRLVQCAL